MKKKIKNKKLVEEINLLIEIAEKIPKDSDITLYEVLKAKKQKELEIENILKKKKPKDEDDKDDKDEDDKDDKDEDDKDDKDEDDKDDKDDDDDDDDDDDKDDKDDKKQSKIDYKIEIEKKQKEIDAYKKALLGEQSIKNKKADPKKVSADKLKEIKKLIGDN